MDYPQCAIDYVAKNVQGTRKMHGNFPACVIEETKYINTFSNATYKLKLDDCYHLLAVDNSYRKDFAILVKEISPGKKTVKVIFNGKTAVTIEGDSSSPILKVNGTHLEIASNEKKAILDHEHKQVADVVRYSDNTLSLQAVYSLSL